MTFFTASLQLDSADYITGCYHSSSLSTHTAEYPGGLYCVVVWSFCVIVAWKIYKTEEAEEQTNRNRMQSENTGKLGNEACKNTVAHHLTRGRFPENWVWVFICFKGNKNVAEDEMKRDENEKKKVISREKERETSDQLTLVTPVKPQTHPFLHYTVNYTTDFIFRVFFRIFLWF